MKHCDSIKHTRVLSRQEFNRLPYEKDQQISNKKSLRPFSGSHTLSSSEILKVVNTLFSNPFQKTQRNGYALRRAVAELKPCIDLRKVRRGRKVFQIPRVLSPTQRQLFGVRRLLSICASTSARNTHTPVNYSEPFSRQKEKNIETNSQTPLSLRKTLVKKADSKKQSQIDSTSPLIGQNQSPLDADLYLTARDALKSPHTRTGFLRAEGKVSSSPLSNSLSREIKACSQSRSRSIESKKQTYKVASANRGSIRMAWWL